MARGSNKGGGRGSARKGGGGAGGASGASAGAIRAGAAFVELFTKDSKLKAGLDMASIRLRTWAKNVAKLGHIAFGTGVGILAPLTALLAKGVGRAEQIGDVADVFGLTAESASKMASAFEIAGGSIEELETSLSKLALANKEGKPLDEYFRDVAKELSEIDNASERFQEATKIFPKGFARNFLDNGLDVIGLLNSAPALSSDSIANAKAFRMEWTRVGIVFQDSLLPVLSQLRPYLQTVSTTLQQNARYLPALMAGGAALVGIGVGLYGVSTILSVASMGLAALGVAVGAILSPLGLLTAGIVAGGLAWVAFSDKGGESILKLKDFSEFSFAEIRDGWATVVKAFAAGDLELTGKIAFLSLQIEWAKMLGRMKEAAIAWKTAIKEILQLAVDIPAVGIASIGEGLGVVPQGTGKEITRDSLAERERIRNAGVLESQRALAALNKELEEARAQFAKLKGQIPELKMPIKDAIAEVHPMGKSDIARGAFNVGNSAQFFNGGVSYAAKQLKKLEELKAEMAKVASALIGVPIAIIR